MRRFANKTAVVTGASRGIGRTIAERLGRESAAVAVVFRSSDEARWIHGRKLQVNGAKV